MGAEGIPWSADVSMRWTDVLQVCPFCAKDAEHYVSVFKNIFMQYKGKQLCTGGGGGRSPAPLGISRGSRRPPRFLGGGIYVSVPVGTRPPVVSAIRSLPKYSIRNSKSHIRLKPVPALGAAPSNVSP